MNFIFRIKCLRASGGNSSAAAVEYKTLKYPQRTCGQDSLLGLIDAKFLHVSWCKENVGKECKSDKKIVIGRKGCLSAGGQQKAGWYWRCGRRPYSFCDVLWHTDGSWHNTDRLSFCALTPTLTPLLQNGCFLSVHGSMPQSSDLIDRHTDRLIWKILLPFPTWFLSSFFNPFSIAFPLYSHLNLDEAVAHMQRSWKSQLNDLKWTSTVTNSSFLC